VVTHQLQVERRTGNVRRPKTDVLPLCHATNVASTVLLVWTALYTCVVRKKTLSAALRTRIVRYSCCPIIMRRSSLVSLTKWRQLIYWLKRSDGECAGAGWFHRTVQLKIETRRWRGAWRAADTYWSSNRSDTPAGVPLSVDLASSTIALSASSTTSQLSSRRPLPIHSNSIHHPACLSLFITASRPPASVTVSSARPGRNTCQTGLPSRRTKFRLTRRAG